MSHRKIWIWQIFILNKKSLKKKEYLCILVFFLNIFFQDIFTHLEFRGSCVIQRILYDQKNICAQAPMSYKIFCHQMFFFNSFIIQNGIQLFFLNYFIMQFFLNSFYHTIVFFTSTKYFAFIQNILHSYKIFCIHTKHFAFIQNILHEWMQNIVYECKIFCVHTKHFAFIQNFLHSYKIFAFIQNIYFISP